MLDISLIMILAALWGAPAGASQADFIIDYSGDNHRNVSCTGKLNFDKRPGAETLRLQQNCKGAGAQDENRELILRFDQHKAYRLNHALKSYDSDELASMPEVMKTIFGDLAGKEPQDFIDGTRLWTLPSKEDFWLMAVQDPSRQARLSEIHLLSPGYGSHMYLSYASEPAKDTYEPPKDYRPQ